MGLFASESANNNDIWSVSGLNAYIREVFEIDYRLQSLGLEGEISNFSRARSGHLYFTLKDDVSQIKCVMWRSAAERLRFNPQEGDAVLINGRVSVYETGGVYQVYADSMQPAGRGNLAQAFEELKQRLQSEGLFDPDYKQPLPRFPRKIGIITSLDAAALRDILNVMRRRYPIAEVLIAPTLVQGNEAPQQIVRALQWIDGRDDVDVLIIGRGGGSIEDLWAFNDERVARAIYAARHPIIAGVGHETDFTIADFVADVRAPTPSAAAELAVPDLSDLHLALQGIQQTLTNQIYELIEQRQLAVKNLSRTLTYLGPQTKLDNGRQRLDVLSERLERAIQIKQERLKNRHELWHSRLLAMSPQHTLARGYAIVRDEAGRVIRSAAQVVSEQPLTIQLSDGEIDVKTT